MIRLILLLALLPVATLAASPKFRDESAALPVRHVYSGGWTHFVGGGVAVFDCNGDGKPDIVAAGGSEPARLFVNQTPGPGDFAFVQGDGLPVVSETTGAYPIDIDGDGILDLVLLRVGPNLILKGQGNCRFSPGPWAIDQGHAWTTAFSATWEGGNALPTLAFGNYVDRDNPNGPFRACDKNELVRPEGADYGPPIPLKPGFCTLSILFSDYQRRGVQDLRLSNDRQYYVSGGHEQMLHMPDLTWLTAKDGWKPISIWGMGIASQDLKGDGHPDVVLTSMGDQLMQVYTPQGYVPAPFSIGTYAQRPFIGDDGRPSTGWHAEFADVDNDGRADLFIAKGNVDQMASNAMKDPNNLLMQQPDGTFRECALEAGVASTARSRGAALADFDGDGRLDLVVVNRRAPMELYRNVTEGSGHWLAIRPREKGGNAFAVGAFVEVRTDKGTQTREITIGGGHAGGQSLPIHFGLGDATSAEVRVTWPGGADTGWLPYAADQTVAVWRKTP